MAETADVATPRVRNEDNLKRSIGTWGAIGIATNQIIGGGIVALTGVAIAITGGGVAWAFVLAAISVMIVSIPYALLSAADPVAGAQYRWPAKYLNPSLGFINTWVLAASQMSLALYGLSAGAYLQSIWPGIDARLVAFAMITFFFVLNLFGAALGARASIVMLISMALAFGTFAVLGLSKVDFVNYPPAVPNGVVQLLSAAALLTFATGGAVVVAELGRELKNPGRSIPIAIIGGTGLIGILYVLVAIPAAGILPIAEVAGQPLSVVSQEFLPRSAWLFFIIGGAIVALVSTMNSQLLVGSRALMVASDDGWLPASLGRVSKRYGIPYVLLTILYVLGQVPIWTGLDVGVIANAASLFGQLLFILVALCSIVMRLKAPWIWERSPFKVPLAVHWVLVVATVCLSCYQGYLLAQGFTTTMVIAVSIWLLIGLVLMLINRKRVDPVPIQTAAEMDAFAEIERAQEQAAATGKPAPTAVRGEHESPITDLDEAIEQSEAFGQADHAHDHAPDQAQDHDQDAGTGRTL